MTVGRGLLRVAKLASLAACFLLFAGRTLVAAEEGFEPIFNGRDLDGWVIESHADSEIHPDGRPVWSVKDGEIDCDGLGFGFLRYAREPFADVTLRIEFQLGKTSDGELCNAGIGLRTGVFDRRRSRATRSPGGTRPRSAFRAATPPCASRPRTRSRASPVAVAPTIPTRPTCPCGRAA
jgi:hypothetical protein